MGILLNGTPEDRLQVADSLPRDLELDELPGASGPAADDVIDDLILVLRQEPDDWIARTLLNSIRWSRELELNRLRREALALPSVNLQAIAIDHYRYHEDAESIVPLESLWERD